MRITVRLTEAPVEALTAILRSDDLRSVERNPATGQYEIWAIPVDPARLLGLATVLAEIDQGEQIADGAVTQIVQVYRPPHLGEIDPTSGQRWAFCPDHPLWEPLTRRPERRGWLICTATACNPPYQIHDPDYRYANT